jgi:hypothetical protein
VLNTVGITGKKIAAAATSGIKAVSDDLADLELRLPDNTMISYGVSGYDNYPTIVPKGSIMWHIKKRDITTGQDVDTSGIVDVFTQDDADELEINILKRLAVNKTYEIPHLTAGSDYPELNDLIDKIVADEGVTKAELSGIKIIVVTDENHPYAGTTGFETWLYYFTFDSQGNCVFTPTVRIDGNVNTLEGVSGIEVIPGGAGGKDQVGITAAYSGYIKNVEDIAKAAISKDNISGTVVGSDTVKEVITSVQFASDEANKINIERYASNVETGNSRKQNTLVKAFSGITLVQNASGTEINISAKEVLDYATQISGTIVTEIGRIETSVLSPGGVSGDLDAEIARAMAMEKAISGNLKDEIARAVTAENGILKNLGDYISGVSGDLNIESTRREMADIASSEFSNIWVAAQKISGILLTLTMNDGTTKISGLIDNSIVFDEGSWDV